MSSITLSRKHFFFYLRTAQATLVAEFVSAQIVLSNLEFVKLRLFLAVFDNRVGFAQIAHRSNSQLFK